MVVAGTGHRPNKLGGYSDEAFFRLVKIASDWIIDNKPKRIISGMALGWDQALAWAAIDNKIDLHCYVPFEGQDGVWPLESRVRYHYILSRCNAKILCSEGPYTQCKMQTRNEMMVDNSDLILAMWDGSSGGTANCVRYANKLSKPIVNLYQKYLLTLENDNS